jgi:hypothetical protein
VANGKRGDHPLTDILAHDIPVFDSEVDQLIKDLAPTGIWASPLIQFLLLETDTEIEKLRGSRPEAANAYLSNLAGVLREELRGRATYKADAQ